MSQKHFSFCLDGGSVVLLLTYIEEGVVVDFLRQEDHAGVAEGVLRAPVDGPGLLLLAVRDGGDGVALDTDAQPVPLAVGELRTELDAVLLPGRPALIGQPVG